MSYSNQLLIVIGIFKKTSKNITSIHTAESGIKILFIKMYARALKNQIINSKEAKDNYLKIISQLKTMSLQTN